MVGPRRFCDRDVPPLSGRRVASGRALTPCRHLGRDAWPKRWWPGDDDDSNVHYGHFHTSTMNSSPQNTNNAGTVQRRTTGVDNSDEEEWSGVVECVINRVIPNCFCLLSPTLRYYSSWLKTEEKLKTLLIAVRRIVDRSNCCLWFFNNCNFCLLIAIFFCQRICGQFF